MTTIIVKQEGTNGSEFRVSTIVAPPMPHINQKGRGQENSHIANSMVSETERPSPRLSIKKQNKR